MANFVRCSVNQAENLPINIDQVVRIYKLYSKTGTLKLCPAIAFEVGKDIFYWKYTDEKESLRNADFERIVGGEKHKGDWTLRVMQPK